MTATSNFGTPNSGTPNLGTPHEQDPHATFDRRQLLRVGGLAVVGGAVLAACGEESTGDQIPIAGESPTYAPLEDKPVTDNVLLRTASSFEWSLVDAYQKLLDNGYIADPQIVELVKTFQAHHIEHATTLASLTAQAGGTPCAALNEKITSYSFQPIIQEIASAGPTQEDDATAFISALENLAGATHQAFVPQYSQPSLRNSAMAIGGVEGRHAAIIAAVLNPDDLVGTAAAAAAPATPSGPTTTVVTGLPTTAPGPTTTALPSSVEANDIIAIPGAFGSLASISVVVGEPDANGNRETFTLETPSLNSFIYDGEDEYCDGKS